MPEERNNGSPTKGVEKNFSHLVADAADHVVERRDAQAKAKHKKTQNVKGPLLALLLVMFGAVAGWNVYYFTSDGRVTPREEETFLRTSIYLTALTLNAEFRETGVFPASLEEIGMDEEGLTYDLSTGGYTLVAQGAEVRVEYRSDQDLIPFQVAFESLRTKEVRQ